MTFALVFFFFFSSPSLQLLLSKWLASKALVIMHSGSCLLGIFIEKFLSLKIFEIS